MHEVFDVIVNKISRTVGRVQRKKTFSIRDQMFEDMLSMLTEEPDRASVLFGQDKLLASAKVVNEFIDSTHGIFIFTMQCDYFNYRSSHSYSLYLTGDILRIGLLLSGGVEKAPLADWDNEMNDLWPGTPPTQQNRQDVTLYEWTFGLPDLYSNYVTRERFVFGMRHMQGRVLRIVRDYFKMLSEGKD